MTSVGYCALYTKVYLCLEQVTLTVVAANEGAVAMYQNLGFETVGTHRRTFKTIPGGVYHDEIIMAKFL